MICFKNMKMYASYLDECYRHIFGNTVIKSWGYLYYDLSGRYLQLMSDKLLLEDFFKNELFIDQIIDNLSNPYMQFYSSDVVNDALVPNPVKKVLMLQGYTHFFDIIHKHADYSEVYTFATLENPVYANNYALNNLDILKIISQDLSVRCRRLLTKDNMLILPNDFIIQMNELQEIHSKTDSLSLKDIIMKSKDTACTLFEKVSDDVFDFNKLPFSFLASKELTHREKEIIYLYYQDFNAHRIAEILDLSKRTVDKHFDNIKTKLNCESIGQIIPALLKYDYLLKDLMYKK